MASEALQNQLLLDQMFARSLAPINQALEVQRQRVQQQQDWERNMQQRERELMMEQTFRSQQNREQLAAQAAVAKAQQEAIGAREIESEKRANQRITIDQINASPYLTDKQKEEARSDPAKAEEYRSKIVGLAVEEDSKSIKALNAQAEAAMKEAVYAMATESKSLPPETLAKVNTEWLAGQDAKVQRVLYPILQSGKTLTPEIVDKALKDARGMFGYGIGGINDDSIMTAALGYRSALAAAGGSKEPSPGAQRAITRYQNLHGQLTELVKTPSGRIAANRFVQEKQAESEELMSQFKAQQETDMAKRVKDTPLEPADAFAPRQVQGAAVPVPAPATPQMGGLLGGAREVVQAVPGALASAGNWAYNTGNAVQDFGAGVVGGDYLKGLVQQQRAKAEADYQALMQQATARQEAVDPALYNFAPF